MAVRQSNKLNARIVSTASEGRHSDGDGLYLDVDAGGAKRWAFIYQWHEKRREMGLGRFPAVSLADARELRAVHRRELASGIDPIAARKAARAPVPTDINFGPFSEAWLDDLEVSWRNPKHRQQWRNTLRTYAKSISTVPVSEVSTDMMLKILRPIWTTKAETASRVRGRIERVLDAAKAKGLRTGENPARWKGHLEMLLPKPLKLTRGHHKALPVDELPSFMAKLKERDAGSARALEFLIATAAREGEVLGATWAEIDLANRMWTVPAERMKAKKPHRVFLSDLALAALGAPADDGRLLFPGARSGGRLSNTAMDNLVRRLGRDVTVHGFRSTFRDWAGDCTDHPREVIEGALAHNIGNAVERAYRRGDAFEKRSALMADWSDYCQGATSPVSVSIAA